MVVESVVGFGAGNKPDSFSCMLFEAGSRYTIPEDTLSAFGKAMQSTN
jgi:hypothetical protein